MAYILQGVGEIELFSGDQLILTSKTLTESGISVDVSSEDIRGGYSAPIIGRYFHSSALNLNLTDATFDLQYLALNMGGNITMGGSAITTESYVMGGDNTITVSGAPLDFNGLGTIGWATIAGADNWQKVDFTGSSAPFTASSGTEVCVKYVNHYDNAREFIVPSNIIPAECYAVLKAPLFAVNAQNFAASAKVAELIVEIPRFQLSGSNDFSMSMTGASTSSLSGTALAVMDTTSCESGGYFARIKEIRYTGSVYDTLMSMSVANNEIELSQGETETIRVKGIYSGNIVGNIPNADLTFVSGTPSVASVDNNTGVITASTNGSSLITITLTSKPDVVAYANVTVG